MRYQHLKQRCEANFRHHSYKAANSTLKEGKIQNTVVNKSTAACPAPFDQPVLSVLHRQRRVQRYFVVNLLRHFALMRPMTRSGDFGPRQLATNVAPPPDVSTLHTLVSMAVCNDRPALIRTLPITARSPSHKLLVKNNVGSFSRQWPPFIFFSGCTNETD